MTVVDAEPIIRAATAIPGWMTLEELRYLIEVGARAQHIVEIGSWQGRSTKALAMATSGVVYSVDDFRGEAGTPLPDGQQELLYRANLRDELASGTVIHVHAPSVKAARDFDCRGMSFDAVFIDGSHDLTSVILDIAYWQPLVAPGGVLCGHDWGVGEVKEALELVLPTARQVPGAGTIWEWRAE